MPTTLKGTARTLAISAGLVGLAVAAGCSNSEVRGTASAPTDVVDNGPVRDAGDTVWKDICQVATEAQISQYNLERGTGSVTDRGTPQERRVGCMWTVEGEPYSVHVRWSTGGIADKIDDAKRHEYPELQELEIDGQKAAIVKTEVDGRSCAAHVGMDPRLTFRVQIVYERDATDRSRGCSLAADFAEEFAPNTTK